MARKLKSLGYLSGTLFIILLTTVSAHAEDANGQALALIAETAAKICQVAPLTQQNSQVVLSGNAKASVNGIISKLADLGIDGAAKYTSGSSNGVLQQDLVAVLKDGNDCKLQVFNKLVDKLLGDPSHPATVHRPAPSVNGVSLGADSSSVSSLDSFGSPPTYYTTTSVRMGVGFSERQIEFNVYFDIQNGRISRIELQHHASVKCSTNFGKSVLDTALKRFGQPQAEPTVSTGGSTTDFVVYKYYFSDGSFDELLTITDKPLPTSDTVPWCKVKIEYKYSL